MELFGYKIFKRKFLDTVFFNREKALRSLVGDKKTPVIFDVGANTGQSVVSFKAMYPDAVIHSFEPDVDAFALLKKTAGEYEHVSCMNVGIGAESGELPFYRYSNSVLNSFKQINETSFSITSGVHPGVNQSLGDKVNIDRYPIITLDEYIKSNDVAHVNILKIDVQGFELEVLKGVKQALGHNAVDIIVCELVLDDVYGSGHSFGDIETIICKHGYRLWDISHIYKDLQTYRTCWVDCIYISSKTLGRITQKSAPVSHCGE